MAESAVDFFIFLSTRIDYVAGRRRQQRLPCLVRTLSQS
jgi:hypothetical protein